MVKWLEKLKRIKNIEIIVAVVLCVIVLIVFFADIGGKPKETLFNEQFTYGAELEKRLTDILSKIDGVDKVSVAITFDGEVTQVYAVNRQTQTTGGTVTERSEVVVVNGQPLIEREQMPAIVGVVVVMDGADNAVCRLRVIDAITALLPVQEYNVKILTHKK